MTTMTKTFKFSDELIAQLAKLLQLSILTGTNLRDNFYRLSVTEGAEAGELVLTDEYREHFENSIQNLLDEAEGIKTAMQETTVEA